MTTPLALDVARGAAQWRQLGTYVQLRTTPDLVEAAAARARDILDEVDRAASRFRDDSDLARVNTHPGVDVEVSPVLVAAVTIALDAARESDGLVDPTLGPSLRAAGYDRTFALVPAHDPSPAALPRPRPRWSEVVVGERTVRVPEAGLLDLGATGKAFAADLVATDLDEQLGAPLVISVGGDVRVVGCDPATIPAFPVALGHTLAEVEARLQPTVGARLRSSVDASTSRAGADLLLHDGGVATSSRRARAWRRADQLLHHVIDPRTGRPATGPWESVTAVGRTATAANTATTAALVLGHAAYGWLTDHDVAARLLAEDGTTLATPAWTAMEEAA